MLARLNYRVASTSIAFAAAFASSAPRVRSEELSPSSASSSSGAVTDYAYFDLKIANYTEESVGTNKGAGGSGVIKIALFGKDAPLSVARFLATVDGDGNTLPSFANCQFSRIVNGSLLEMERVRGINKISIAGSESFEFQGSVLMDYRPILEQNGLRHDRPYLLTRKQLLSGPEFGITVAAAPELDPFHVVFGEVVGGRDVLDAIASVPTYSYKTATGYAGAAKGGESGVMDAWFEGQRKLFVDVGKQLGDSRAADLRGRLLRRVVVKSAGRAPPRGK